MNLFHSLTYYDWKKNMQKSTQKQGQTAEQVVESSNELIVPKKLNPAAVLGMSTKIDIAEESLPEGFKGVNLETIETGFDPTVKWNQPGDFVAGVFEGYEKGVGPNDANLYSFDAKGKKFGVWGNTVLDRALITAINAKQLEPGNMVLIVFIGTIPSKQTNETMIFTIKVVRK